MVIALCMQINTSLDDIYFDDVLLESFSEIAESIYDEIMNEDSDYNFDMAEILMAPKKNLLNQKRLIRLLVS